MVWPAQPTVLSTTRWNARVAASLVAKTPTACLTRWVSSFAERWAVAPLNEARSGSAYTSGSPMSAQLLHSGASTQNAWKGAVNVDVGRHRRADDVAHRALAEHGVGHHARDPTAARSPAPPDATAELTPTTAAHRSATRTDLDLRRQRDVDVAAGGLRVRAHAVRLLHELVGRALLEAGQVADEVGGDAEAALGVLAEADLRGDAAGVVDGDLLVASPPGAARRGSRPT